MSRVCRSVNVEPSVTTYCRVSTLVVSIGRRVHVGQHAVRRPCTRSSTSCCARCRGSPCGRGRSATAPPARPGRCSRARPARVAPARTHAGRGGKRQNGQPPPWRQAAHSPKALTLHPRAASCATESDETASVRTSFLRVSTVPSGQVPSPNEGYESVTNNPQAKDAAGNRAPSPATAADHASTAEARRD